MGAKGGNNVASLLVHDLQKKGWIIEGKSSKSLTIILDNCGGQNKNKYILQLPMYLVEMGYFEEVLIMFYICGHTKNPCDHLFNQLKLEFHRSQVYTFDQLLECLNQKKHVHVFKGTEDMF